MFSAQVKAIPFVIALRSAEIEPPLPSQASGAGTVKYPMLELRSSSFVTLSITHCIPMRSCSVAKSGGPEKHEFAKT
jgi:hypothetical protein